VDVNAHESVSGATALQTAAAAGNTELVEVLLGAGADTYVEDESGTSPLMAACAEGHAAAAKVRVQWDIEI
jgi:ankyrin repeat protein